MTYYLFETELKNERFVNSIQAIKPSNKEYIKYNKFLTDNYFTNLEENEDYIPSVGLKTTHMILRDDLFTREDIPDIFNLIQDVLFADMQEIYKSI